MCRMALSNGQRFIMDCGKSGVKWCRKQEKETAMVFEVAVVFLCSERYNIKQETDFERK